MNQAADGMVAVAVEAEGSAAAAAAPPPSGVAGVDSLSRLAPLRAQDSQMTEDDEDEVVEQDPTGGSDGHGDPLCLAGLRLAGLHCSHEAPARARPTQTAVHLERLRIWRNVRAPCSMILSASCAGCLRHICRPLLTLQAECRLRPLQGGVQGV